MTLQRLSASLLTKRRLKQKNLVRTLRIGYLSHNSSRVKRLAMIVSKGVKIPLVFFSVHIYLSWVKGKFIEVPNITYKELLLWGNYQNWFNNEAHVKRWAPQCYTRKKEEYGFFSEVPCLILRIGVDYDFNKKNVSSNKTLQNPKKV